MKELAEDVHITMCAPRPRVAGRATRANCSAAAAAKRKDELMPDQVENLGDDEYDQMAMVVDVPLERLLHSDDRPLTRALQRVLHATDRSDKNYAAFGNAP